MEKRKPGEIEEYIFGLFRGEGSDKLLTQRIFESTARCANADLVRAFEEEGARPAGRRRARRA
jgi:hypothetical protein